MATPTLFEDQTDEDFFDKLVDDEFGIDGSNPSAEGMTRALSNLSIGDMAPSGEDSAEVFEGGDAQESSSAQASAAPQTEVLASDNNTNLLPSGSCAVDEAFPSTGDPAHPVKDVGSLDSSTAKTGQKGTRVKEVQWNFFTATGSEQTNLGGFGSYSDFFPVGADDSSDDILPMPEPKDSTLENPVTDMSSCSDTLEQQEDQDTRGIGANSSSTEQPDQHNANANDPQYWENLYPGWKYDYSTGQWYQVDSSESTSTTQLDDYGSTLMTPAEGSQEVTHNEAYLGSGQVVSDRSSDVSYLQLSTQSMLQTVAETSTTDCVANWNQVTEGITEYPSNMVFDPQYPDWYYDTISQQWYTLESYTQSIQMTSSTGQNQLNPENIATSDGYISNQNGSVYTNEVSQFGYQALQGQNNQTTSAEWNGSIGSYSQQNVWQPKTTDRSGSLDGFSDNQHIGNFHSSIAFAGNSTETQQNLKSTEALSGQSFVSNGSAIFQGFVPSQSIYSFNQPKVDQSQQASFSHSYYDNKSSFNYSEQSFESRDVSSSQLSHAPSEGRSSAGRPPHALVAFGFGGKLVIMKDSSSQLPFGSQEANGSTVSILNLADVVSGNNEYSNIGPHVNDYFHALCKQPFPGPLVGGNAATKDLNKWIDERISNCESSSIDFRKGELLRLLLSLLKISCQHYGKLRSPFGADPSVLETDGPESAVTKLFASARKIDTHLREYGEFTHCMHSLPSEGQIRTTAVEVQQLLVSGKRLEALQCAQEGLLWGPALVLAAQLGEKFYVDTVKQMAQRQFVSGSPLRTLCLLIAGQPADVFSVDSLGHHMSEALNASKKALPSGMLDSWEENLAIITANRTKDDELVIVHLGDCLWKERGQITAAHTCYLVAEANFESYSDSARLCLVGADHWKCPRTYATPDAIQRTEVYEYSKVLGNSQYVLLPFQPYKFVYACMLAEVGKVSDSLRYCQAILKLLKNSSRAPEVETWKLLASSLEERLKTHQQGGYGTNLAPAKLVGKLFTSIDRSISRMMGSPPPPLPPLPPSVSHGNQHDSFPMASKVSSSQSSMAISSLMPSTSVESISGWTGENLRSMHNRSVSEPDFGRSPKQAPATSPADASSTDSQSKTSSSGGSSRLGRFGSQLFQKTIGWVARPRADRQAKLGETNKFYYDEKLKRWVEEGAEPPAEEASLPPPPTMTSFQNGGSDYNINSAFKSQSLAANGPVETKPSMPIEHSPGIPPMPSTTNQFSARGRGGVRSRYVDTFNKGGSAANSTFQSPSAPSLKPVATAKFFVPGSVVSSESTGDVTESIRESSSNEDTSSMVVKDSPFSSFSSSSSSYSMQRYPSMDNITPSGSKGMGLQQGNGTFASRSRAASWSGSFSDALNPKMAEFKPSLDEFGAVPSFIPSNPSPLRSTSGVPQLGGSRLGDDLHEVEL